MRFRLILLLLMTSPFIVMITNAQAPIATNNIQKDCAVGLPVDEVDGQTIICGELTVPENWQQPDGRQITINYAILKTASRSPFADPVIYLEGGPGGSTLVNIPFQVETFAELRRYRDVILYDQRGTPFSSPLFCPTAIAEAEIPDDYAYPELPTSNDPEIQQLLDTALTLGSAVTATNCKSYFDQQGIDLSQYSTANSVLDLVAMMDAFDYESYNIYGISYGTNIALELFRYYEANPDAALPPLRAAIIDGNVPPHVDTRGGQAYIVPNNILRVFSDCEAIPTCSAAFPDIRQRAVDLLAQVADESLVIGEEMIESGQLVTLMGNSLNYSLNEAGRVSGIGASYLPLMIDELERGILTTYIGLRDGTLPPAPDDTTDEGDQGNLFGTIAEESSELATTARNLADGIEALQQESQQVSDILESGLPLSGYFVRELRIGVNEMNYFTALLFPGLVDALLAEEPQREYLAAFASGINPELAGVVALMSDDDIEATYHLLAEVRPSLDSANSIATDIITCNDRYGSFDLETIFAGYRTYEAPSLVKKIDVAVNEKVRCALWGLTDESTTLPTPVVTDLPILVANGSVDPATPEEWGVAAYESLTNAYFVTFAYFPHGATTQFPVLGCGPDVATAFLLDPSHMPDIACADDFQTLRYPFALPVSP